MGFNSAFKGLTLLLEGCNVLFVVIMFDMSAIMQEG